MSRYFNSFMDNSSEALEHSWGTSPKAKAREKEYNHWYYQKHKDEIAAVRKQRSAATNSYKQAEKSNNAARRYKLLWSKMFDRYLDNDYLTESDYDRMVKHIDEYARMYMDSKAKSREYKSQGARQKYSAKVGAESFLQRMKNPTAKDLVEFYLDTTVAKVKKSANKVTRKAKKYATEAVSNAEKSAKKYATKGLSTAKKYATKGLSTAEKSAKKYATKAANKAEKYATKAMSTAEKYATKTIKSAANKAKKYVKE